MLHFRKSTSRDVDVFPQRRRAWLFFFCTRKKIKYPVSGEHILLNLAMKQNTVPECISPPPATVNSNEGLSYSDLYTRSFCNHAAE